MPIKNNTIMLTVEEAAEALGCTGARIRQMLIDREMNGRKLNEDKDRSAWLIPQEEVKRAASQQRRKGGRPRIGD